MQGFIIYYSGYVFWLELIFEMFTNGKLNDK